MIEYTEEVLYINGTKIISKKPILTEEERNKAVQNMLRQINNISVNMKCE